MPATRRRWHEILPSMRHLPQAELLEAANDCIAIPDSGDKYVDVAAWLRDLRAGGAITADEYHDLRQTIARYEF
jgi:hypothetical protein